MIHRRKEVRFMEFHEKLQELRKRKNMTQEELAQALYVSRTAISKWESGKGYPSIDSLKAISTFFAISIDDLLSGNEILTIAEQDKKRKEKHLRDLVYGLLDCSISILLFLPFFGQKASNSIQEVSLLSLTNIQPYLKISYLVIVISLVLCGILGLALQNSSSGIWIQNKDKLSLFLSIAGLSLFTISRQPYAAMFTFLFLIIKALMLIKWE